MVDQQLVARGVHDPLVLQAMRRVPRHELVPPAYQDQAYADQPLPIGAGQTISQPYVVAVMVELARLDSQSRVLEIGTGSGYQTAILAELAAEVYSIEVVPELGKRAARDLQHLGYRGIHLRIGDGYQGWPEAAPFDAIIVSAAPPRVPPPLVHQLALGGKLVIPVGDLYQELQVVELTARGLVTHPVFPVRFVPMVGRAQQ